MDRDKNKKENQDVSLNNNEKANRDGQEWTYRDEEEFREWVKSHMCGYE